MSITDAERVELKSSFEDSVQCMGAEGCRRAAEAMKQFHILSNRVAIEEDKGLVVFGVSAPEVCPNYDDLLCQDRIQEA